MKRITKIAAALTIATTAAVGLTGCKSDADKASKNVSTAADQFEVQRKIVGINGITGKYEFYVEGRCSINDQQHQLEVICKHAENEYRKHMIGLSDNTFYVAEQMDPIDVSVYHTRIIIKPENLLPDLDLEMGDQ